MLKPKDLTYLEKVSFIHWLLNDIPFEKEERSVLTFLLGDSEILERVVFVPELDELQFGKDFRYAIALASKDMNFDVKFIEYYEDICVYDVNSFIGNFDDGIDDYLPLREPLYVQIYFPSKMQSEKYMSLFEEVSSVESKELESIMNQIYAFNIEQEINKAIDNKDEKELVRLGNMLTEMKG